MVPEIQVDNTDDFQELIDNKEKQSGITIHFVNEEFDKGEIILQATCEINLNETVETLTKKIQELEFEHFPKAIEIFL